MVANNITDHAGLKPEMEKFRTGYEDLFEESALSMLIADDLTGIFIDVNKAAIKTYGYSHEEFLSLSLQSINSNASQTLNQISSSLYTHHFTKSGDILLVDVKKKTIDYKGRTAELITVVDVTEIVALLQKEIKARQLSNSNLSSTIDAVFKDDDSRFLDQPALINATSDLIWSIDLNVKLVSFNKAYADRILKVTGNPPFAGLQLPATFADKEKYDQWAGFYRRALSGEVFSIDEKFVGHIEGEVKLAEIRFSPIYGVTGDITGAVCHSHDVTDRVRTQLLIEEQNEKLKASEIHLEKVSSQLQKVMDSSLDVICSIDKDGCFKQVSQACQEVWGYTTEELIGTRYMSLVHPDFFDATNKVAAEIMSGAAFTNFQNCYIHKSGSTVPIIWSARWDEEEEIMFCVARDATALKEAEKLTAETETRFTALVQKGVDLVGIIDTVGRYMFVSPNIERVLGHKPEDLLNKSALEFIHPEDVPSAREELEKVIKGGEVKLAAFRFKNAFGEWQWFETIATNQLQNPAIKGIVINSRDITARKQIEAERELMIKELLKSNADLKQFSFITSHNLRAPLSNILGILNIIDYAALDEYNRQMVQMLSSSTKQLQQTIDDLSKILLIKNNVNVELSTINLNEAINDVKGTFINTLNDFCVDITIDFEVEEIEFNKIYFESILVNLMSNSIKYRSRTRNLLIAISSRIDADGNPVFIFSDNGSGIDLSRHKSQVFGLYQRFHNNIEGQGLGLFIIKSQIVALGGKIDIESEPGKGATFTITFKKQLEIDEHLEGKDKLVAVT